MKKLIFILVILALGCTGNTFRPGSELPAVVIREYNFDQDTIRQGQTTGVNLVVQNNGDEKARNIRTKLFRTGEGVGITSIPFVYGTTESITLNPPDENTQTSGESKEFAWQITANTPADKKTTKSYNIGVLVGYDYKSEGFSDLLATTKDQAKIDKNQLPTLRSGSTKGPISVNVITPNALLYEMGGEKVTVRVDVVNGANGIVYSDRAAGEVIGGSNEMNKIKSIELLLPEKYTKAFTTTVGKDLGGGFWCCKPNCDDPQEQLEYAWKITTDTRYPGHRVLKKSVDEGYTNSKGSYKKSLELLRGKQKSYVCYFEVNKDAVTEQQIIPIRAIAEYSYSTEDSKILVVEGAK